MFQGDSGRVSAGSQRGLRTLKMNSRVLRDFLIVLSYLQRFHGYEGAKRGI